MALPVYQVLVTSGTQRHDEKAATTQVKARLYQAVANGRRRISGSRGRVIRAAGSVGRLRLEGIVKKSARAAEKHSTAPPWHCTSRGGVRAREVHVALVVVQDTLEVVPDRVEVGPWAALGEGVGDELNVARDLEDADQNVLVVVLDPGNLVARVAAAVVPEVSPVPFAAPLAGSRGAAGGRARLSRVARLKSARERGLGRREHGREVEGAVLYALELGTKESLTLRLLLPDAVLGVRGGRGLRSQRWVTLRLVCPGRPGARARGRRGARQG